MGAQKQFFFGHKILKYLIRGVTMVTKSNTQQQAKKNLCSHFPFCLSSQLFFFSPLVVSLGHCPQIFTTFILPVLVLTFVCRSKQKGKKTKRKNNKNDIIFFFQTIPSICLQHNEDSSVRFAQHFSLMLQKERFEEYLLFFPPLPLSSLIFSFFFFLLFLSTCT